MTRKSPRQECAEIIAKHPGISLSGIIEIIATTRKAPIAATLNRPLRGMIRREELTRTGTNMLYLYYPGPNIQQALTNEHIPGAPEPKKRGGSRYRLGVMQISQTWVAQGDYTIEPGEMIYRSLWDYANSFTQLES